jgi:hypothetical protein
VKLPEHEPLNKWRGKAMRTLVLFAFFPVLVVVVVRAGEHLFYWLLPVIPFAVVLVVLRFVYKRVLGRRL